MERRALDLSLLGYGCMRFPKKAGRIDMAATEKLILAACKHGITYYDTAYIYPGSEEALGTILQKHHLREKVYIATKIPHYLVKSVDDMEKIFQTSLERLKTTYVDNLLMHMLPDITIWNKLKAMGVDKWIEEKKAAGQIRHIGFSFHGNSNAFIELLDAYPWEFCQCQYNYMDEHSQAGRRGVEHAYELGIPVIIMEPLRGGRLVNGLPEEAARLLRSTAPSWRQTADGKPAGRSDDPAGEAAGDRSEETKTTRVTFRQAVHTGSARAIRTKRQMRAVTPAEWGLCWLFDQKEISVVLSGMSDMAMLAENIRLANHAHVGMYNDADRAVIEKVKAILDKKVPVRCTGCGYCMPCPFGVDIPGCFRSYNDRAVDGYVQSMKEYLMTTTFRAEKSYASLCKKCGRCEKLCPQGIPIREKLRETARHMEGPVFKVVNSASKGLFKGNR